MCHGTGSREKSQKHRTVRPVKQLVSKPGEPPPRPGLLPQVRADKLRSDPGVLVRSEESKFHCSRAGTVDQQSDAVHALPFGDGSIRGTCVEEIPILIEKNQSPFLLEK